MYIRNPYKKFTLIFLALVFLLLSCYGCSSDNGQLPTAQYIYDERGNLVFCTLPDGTNIQMKYNDMGLLVEAGYPEGLIKYGYDEKGNRIWTLDAKGGGCNEYFYDAFDRLVGFVWQHSMKKLVVYAYNTHNNLTALKVYDLDAMGKDPNCEDMVAKLTAEPNSQEKWNVREESFRQVLDTLQSEGGEKNWLQYGVDYKYDVLGNVIEVKSDGESVQYSYKSDDGSVTRKLPNGITSDYSCSKDGALDSVIHRDISGEVISAYSYQYNAAGLVSKIAESGIDGQKTTDLIWDKRGFLSQIAGSDGSLVKYGYDTMGNRLSEQTADGVKQYTYDDLGQLANAGGSTFQWDKNGYISSLNTGKEQYDFDFDSRGFLESISSPSGISKYAWDGDGNLVSSINDNTATYSLPNPLAINGCTLIDFDSSGKVINSYLYADTLIGQKSADGDTQYFLGDGPGNITSIVDHTGNMLEHSPSIPFLKTDDSFGFKGTPFYASGMRNLIATSMYMDGAQIYDPSTDMHYSYNLETADIYTDTGCDQLINLAFPINTNKKVNIFIGGMFQTERDLEFLKQKGFDVVIALPFNSLSDAIDSQCFGGYLNLRTNENYVLSILKKYKNIGILAGYSQGGITVGNLYKELDNMMQNGTEIDEIRILGAAEHENLKNICNRNSTKYIVPEGTIIDGKKDLIRFLATYTNIEYGRKISPGTTNNTVLWFKGAKYKALDLVDAFIHGKISKEPHDLNLYLELASVSSDSSVIPDLSDIPFMFSDNINIPTDIDIDDTWNKWAPLPPGPSNSPNGGGAAVNNTPGPVVSGDEFGGILINPEVQFTGNLENITGAVYDPEKQVFVLLSNESQADKGLAIKAEDLAVALKLVYGPNPQDPAFTLDPYDPSNPRGEWLRAVYLPDDILSGTTFGKAMYEADWLLKQYSFGVKVDEKGSVSDRTSAVSGFKSVSDLMFENWSDNTQESWSRFWITPDAVKLKQTGNSVQFDTVTMKVNAKAIVPDPTSPQGYRDVDSDNPISVEFADIFTKYYDQLAKESPGLERVRDLTKAMALAKWMKSRDIPVDMVWVEQYAGKNTATVEKVKALDVSHERTEESGNTITTKTVSLFGGVDLAVTPEYTAGTADMSDIENAVYASLESQDQPVFTMTSNGEQFKAMVIPLTKNGQALYDQAKANASVKYDYNEINRILHAAAADGSTADYTYDESGKLYKISIDKESGWKVDAQRDNKGSSWLFTDPAGYQFEYEYDDAGFLYGIKVDGKEWANVEKSGDGRKAIINYGDYTEQYTFNTEGSVSEYTVTSSQPCSGVNSAEYSFNNQGCVTEVKLDGKSLVQIQYPPDGMNIFMPQSEILISYDSEGSVNQIIYNGRNYSIAEENGSKVLRIDSQGKKAEYVFGPDGLTESADFLGGKTVYEYRDGNLVSLISADGGKTTYSYDDNGRLIRVSFPDNSWDEYRYEDDQNGNLVKVIVVKHMN